MGWGGVVVVVVVFDSVVVIRARCCRAAATCFSRTAAAYAVALVVSRNCRKDCSPWSRATVGATSS